MTLPAVQKLRDSRARSPAGAPLCGVATRENRTDTYTVVCTRVNIQSDTPAHPRVGKYENKLAPGPNDARTSGDVPATEQARGARDQSARSSGLPEEQPPVPERHPCKLALGYA